MAVSQTGNHKREAVRKAIYSGPNRSGTCVCGHKWDEHHLAVVVRPEAIETDGGPETYIPQECEYFGSNEIGGLDEEGNSHCLAYRDNLDEPREK